MPGNSSSTNYGFGEVSRKRGEWKKYAACVFVGLFVGLLGWMAPVVPLQRIKQISVNGTKLDQPDLYFLNIYHLVFFLPIVFYSAIIVKWLQCFFVMVEELKHIKTRHKNSFRTLVENCYQVFWTLKSWVGLGISLLIVHWMRSMDKELFDNHFVMYWPIVVTSVGINLITNYILGFETLSVVELSEIHESSNVYVAQGLAWSYFTGYLKIILKDLQGTIKKDEKKWKKEYEDGNLQSKFYAIIPLNCKIPSKLGESEKHRGITFEGKLPTLFVDRAGVKDRPYVNSVYKIDNEKGEYHYAICEYVTIIDTLFQMPSCTDFDPQNREEQCRLLVRKLRELIESDDECREKCVIVMFSGEDEGPLLRDVLLDRIKENRLQING
ncbi:stimulator of interferon genes protein 3-like [Antedon mediterranea]|uniref:stimulator of interferon genes protein 3-like n=1 Tax=Antedon mediterranea TaxID=105859 RepID=UPI003AF71DC1